VRREPLPESVGIHSSNRLTHQTGRGDLELAGGDGGVWGTQPRPDRLRGRGGDPPLSNRRGNGPQPWLGWRQDLSGDLIHSAVVGDLGHEFARVQRRLHLLFRGTRRLGQQPFRSAETGALREPSHPQRGARPMRDLARDNRTTGIQQARRLSLQLDHFQNH
jgi:hypothetical protein